MVRVILICLGRGGWNEPDGATFMDDRPRPVDPMSKAAALCAVALLSAVALIVGYAPADPGVVAEMVWVAGAISGFCLLCLLESEAGTS